jgi:protein-disulfide isomerase
MGFKMHRIINRILLLTLLILIGIFGYRSFFGNSTTKNSLVAKTVVASQEDSEKELKSKTQEIIKEYLLENPEIIVDALNQLQKRKMEEIENKVSGYISDKKDEIQDTSSGFIMGNEKASATIVYFFDYNCGYCKKGFKILQELIQSDKDIRVILRPIPILGDSSGYATKVAFAIKMMNVDKFDAFQSDMLLSQQVTKETIDQLIVKYQIAQSQVNEVIQKPEIGNLIHRNLSIAENLRIQGSPAYIIGNKFFPGLLELTQLQKIVAEARSSQNLEKQSDTK